MDRLRSLSLVELWLDNGAGITDAAVEKLSRMQSLTCLRIPGTSITAEGAEKLNVALPNCLIIEGEREPVAD